MKKPNVIVIGGSFAGLTAAFEIKRLLKHKVDVTVIARQELCSQSASSTRSQGIEDMDKNIGSVIQYLKDTGQYNNTFIVFTSDNGNSEPLEKSDFRYANGVNLTLGKQ